MNTPTLEPATASAKRLASDIINAGFAAAVMHELRLARAKHKPHQWLEQSGAVIQKQVEDLNRAIRHCTKADILTELIQIGAMAQRMAEDLGLTQSLPSYYAKRS